MSTISKMVEYTAAVFEYDDGAGTVPDNHFRLSASGIGRFFTDSNKWWRENLLGEAGFQGSTASYLGTVVHSCCEAVASEVHPSTTVIDAFLKSIPASPDVDKRIIKAQYPIMAENIVNNYLLQPGNMPTNVEDFLWLELHKPTYDHPSIGVGGSCDAAIFTTDTQGMIVDYKTTSALTPPTSIKYEYRLQLQTYAYLYWKTQGKKADRIRIVYVTRNQVNRISEKTGKPMKDYPSQVAVLDEVMTDTDYESIESILRMMADSVKLWYTDPSLRYILAKDGRLRE